MMKKRVLLTVEVESDQFIPAHEIGEVIDRLIHAGQEDAKQTIEEGDGDIDLAEMALGLNVVGISGCELGASFHAHTHAHSSNNRCLIIVSGGVADYLADEGVDVEIFDWDNFNADNSEGRECMRLPTHFKDLALAANVPVRG